MNGQLRSKVVPVKYDKKNVTDEYDQKIEYLNKFMNYVDFSKLKEQEIRLCVAESVKKLKDLIENEYFQLNYVHNPVKTEFNFFYFILNIFLKVIKKFVLRIIEICFEQDQNYKVKILFKIKFFIFSI